MYDYLETPAVAIELDTVERNIRTLVENAAKHGISHRPHTKTHCCVVCNMLDEVYGIRNGKVDHMIRIDARGKSI